MTVDDIIALVAALPGVTVDTAGPDTGAPEVAWGDTFFSYDGGFPFATIVVSNYPGFDEASELDRPGVFRLNIGVGRELFAQLIGHSVAEPAVGVDHRAADLLLPHPVYATQGWVAIVNPGERTAGQAVELLREAHARAAGRKRP